MRNKIIILLITSLLLSGSCSLFEKDEEHPYKGITETILENIDGDLKQQIISEDEDDWALTNENITMDDFQIPLEYKIGPAFPNPAIDSTYIVLQLPQQDSVKISIKNEDGKVVKTLIDKLLPAGYYHVYWNIDENVKSGMYRCFYETNSIDSDFSLSGYGDIKVKK